MAHPFPGISLPLNAGRVTNPPLPDENTRNTGKAGAKSIPPTKSAHVTELAHGELVEPSVPQCNRIINLNPPFNPSFRRKPESRKSPGKERAGYRGFWIPAFAGTTVVWE